MYIPATAEEFNAIGLEMNRIRLGTVEILVCVLYLCLLHHGINQCRKEARSVGDRFEVYARGEVCRVTNGIGEQDGGDKPLARIIRVARIVNKVRVRAAVALNTDIEYLINSLSITIEGLSRDDGLMLFIEHGFCPCEVNVLLGDGALTIDDIQ